MTVLLCFGSSRPEVLENINRIAAEQELLVPDVPVYGDGTFQYRVRRRAHREQLLWVYSRLADDKSRETLENTVNFKLSGKPEYLYRCEVPQDEPLQQLFDARQWRKTILTLAHITAIQRLNSCRERVEEYKSITAVEPDKKSFKKLTANTGLS